MSSHEPSTSRLDLTHSRPLSILVAASLTALLAGLNIDSVEAQTRCSARNGFTIVDPIAAGVGGADLRNRVRLADMDGDGRDDYVVIDEDGALRTWLNRGGDVPGGGGWVYRGKIAGGTGAARDAIRFADINGDRRDDYLVMKPGGAFDAYLNLGGDSYDQNGSTPGWAPQGQVARGANVDPSAIVFADINGDYKEDYLVIKPGGAIDYYENNGGDAPGRDGWIPRGQIARGGAQAGDTVLFADIDCDNRDDYLVLKPNGAVVAFLNDGGDTPGRDGWIPRGQIASGFGSAAYVQFSELNGDGRSDYVIVQANGALKAGLNNGGDP